jgi:hypothetical protein
LIGEISQWYVYCFLLIDVEFVDNKFHLAYVPVLS